MNLHYYLHYFRFNVNNTKRFLYLSYLLRNKIIHIIEVHYIHLRQAFNYSVSIVDNNIVCNKTRL